MKKTTVIVLAVFSALFLIGGGYAFVQGLGATSDVKERIVAQHIVTSEDSAIPGVLVQDADSAIAQADVIGVHASEAVTGMLGADLPYADIAHEKANGEPLSPDDPRVAARGLLASAAGLRSALYGTAAAFELARLVTMLGLAFISLGLLFGFGAFVVGRKE